MHSNLHSIRHHFSGAMLALAALLIPGISCGQTTGTDSTLQEASLDRVIEYALQHQPAVKQSSIDEQVTNKVIKGKLADWYPQINFAYNYQRFIDLQRIVINGNVIRSGAYNTSSAQFTANQTLFNRDVLLAKTTSSEVKQQAAQSTTRSKIDAVVNVTKAFYDVLATKQQINVSRQSIVRLQRSLKDALSRYNSGVADKTDYKRATILLNNAEVALKTNQELLGYKTQLLKTLMGYPSDADLPISYDTLQMEREIPVDTTLELNYTSHIDYKILYTQKQLQEANVKYSNWALLPSLNLIGAYNLNFQNNNFGELYNRKYPLSYVGATLVFPIFQGGKRIYKIQEQKYVAQRLVEGLENLKSNITTEYARSLAAYKSNLAGFQAQKENVGLAEEVYNVIQLQYRSGVRTYLDVTVAESDLRTARINYYNALYQVLASKMDVLRALGQINF